MSLQQRHILDLSEQDEGGDTTEQSATSDSVEKFASSSPPLRNTLRLLEEKGLMPSDHRATRCIVELSNAIEPFLQTCSADDDSVAYTPGRFHPSPSIGLLRCHSRDREREREKPSGRKSPSPSSEGNQVGIKVFLTELQQADIHAALNRALVHIARLEEGSITYSRSCTANTIGDSYSYTADGDPLSRRIMQEEQMQLLKHISGLERQLGHLRAEREKLSAANKAVSVQQGRDNTCLRSNLAQARKDADSSKIALREKECSLQALLTQLSLSQEECKRVRHQYQLLECSSAHTRLQNRLSSVSTTAVSAALGVGVGVSADGGPLSFSKTAHDDEILLSNVKGASVPQLCTGIGAGAGVAVHLLTQDLDKRKVQQQRYGIEAVLGLQASNDVLRQELYHEKGDRARDKTTLSLALAEATARVVLADTVAADCRLELNSEKERREIADRERTELAVQQHIVAGQIGEKEGRIKELHYEVEMQRERAARLEGAMDDMAATRDKETAFFTHRTSDLTECVAKMRIGIAEAQGELATQCMINGGASLRAKREGERIAERLESLVEEYELLWTHSQQQDTYLRCSGDLISSLTQKMTIECSPPSTTKKLLREISILEGKHTQDVMRREEEFRLLIEQLKLTREPANISDGGEGGDSEEKRGEDRVGGDKVIEGGVNQKGREEMETTGSLDEELKGEKVNRDEEIKRSKNVEELLQRELQYNREEISNLSHLLEAAEERVNEQQRALLDREREIAELRSEFLREAIDTSSHLGGMSSRLLALTAENLALKSRPRSRSRSLSVSLQGNEVSDGDGDGDGEAGGVARIRQMNEMTGRDDVVRYDDNDDNDADSYQTSTASSKNSQKRSSSKEIVRATPHPAIFNTARGCSAEGVSSGESKEVEGSAMRGSAACSIRSSRSTVSEDKNSDVTGASNVSHRISGVEVLSYQMSAMETQLLLKSSQQSSITHTGESSRFSSPNRIARASHQQKKGDIKEADRASEGGRKRGVIHSDEMRLPSLQRSSSPVSDMNYGKASRHDRVDSSSIISPPDRAGSASGSRTGSEAGTGSRAGSETGSRAGSVVETGSRAGSETGSRAGSVVETGSRAGSETGSGSRAGSRIGAGSEAGSESERWSDGVVRAGRGSKGRYSTVGARETIGNRSSGESLSRDGRNSNRDRDSDGGVEYGARGGLSDVPCDYGKHASERQEREVEGEGEGDEDDEGRDEGDEGDEAKSAVSLSRNVIEGHNGLYKGPEISRWFGRGGGVRGQVDGTSKISIDFHDRYRGPPRSHMDADSRVDPHAKGNFGISRRDEKDAFKNSLRSGNSEKDENEIEDENEDGDSYNTSSRSVAMHSCTDSDGASTGSERIYRPDTRLISRSRRRTGSDVSTGDEGNKFLGVHSRECKVKPEGDRRNDFKDDRSHSEHSDSQLPPPDKLSPSMLPRSAAGSRRCVMYDEVKLNEGKRARGTSDVRPLPHSQPKSRKQSLNHSMDSDDSRLTEMARKRMLEMEYEQEKERAIGEDDEERAMARVNNQREREREKGRERERAMEKDDGREIAREEGFKRSGDRKRHTIEIRDRDSSSGSNSRNNPSHRQSVHASVYGSADSVDGEREEEEEEEGLGNSMSQESVSSYAEYRSTRPTFITEKVRDPEYPGAGTGAGHYNHLWATAEDHEMHIRALSDQLKCADEAAIQSHLERQEDIKRMKDNMVEDKVRYTEGQRRAEKEKETLLEEFNIEKEKSKALQALLGAHSRGHALGSHSRGHALGSLLEGGDQEKEKAWERERERGASWDTALFTDSTRSTERLGAGVSADYTILREAFEAQLAVLESKIVKRDESLKLLELDCKTKGALLVTMSERVKEGEDIINARADSGRIREQALEQLKVKNIALLDRVDEEEGRYTILEGYRDQDLELFRAEKNDLKAQLSSMMREMARLRGDELDKERDSNARWEEAEGKVEEAVKDKKEAVKRHEKSVKALNEEHRAKELKASEFHDRELQSLLSRLDEAKQTVKQLQSDHRISAIATSASNDQLRQADAEKLRAQLESKYGEHLERVKEQYEARVNRLQMQLTGLHTQLQSMEGNSASTGPRSPPYTTTVTSNPNPPRESIAGSGSGSGAWNSIQGEGEGEGGIKSTLPYENEEKIKESEREREKENLERRIRQAEARSIALTQQLQSMPSCLQVAQAEKRVSEARLQKALTASDARLREQIFALESNKKELKAFLDAAEAERKILLEKVTQRNKTIHQLTHHLHSLQAMVHMQPGSQSGLSEEAILAAEVTFEKSKMDPAPWVPTSTGDRTDRTSTNTSINSHNPSFSFCPGTSYNDVAFAQHITASLQPYRGEPLVLPSRDTSPLSAMGIDGRWRGGRPGNSSTSAPSSPSLQRSSLIDCGAQNVQQMQDACDAPFSFSPLLGHRAGATGAEKRSSGDLLHQSYNQRNERQQQQEEVGEEKSWKRAGDNETGRRTYSKSPTTPSSVSYGRTVVLPWQGPSYPPLHVATRCRDDEGYREDRQRQGQGQMPYIGSRERERVRGEVEHSSGGHEDDFERRRWIESESASARASANMTTPSVRPLMQSVLTTDNATLIDRNRDRGRERDRERNTVGDSDEGYEERRFNYRYSNGDRSSP